MALCDECGRQESMPYDCRHCGNSFCSEHRLPEAHDCPGLKNWNDPKGVFDSGFDDSTDQRGSSSGGVLSGLSATNGPLSYFRGNVSYLFLGLMLLTFVAEQVVVRGFGERLFLELFVLKSSAPLDVWTWLTSVFSHDPSGFTHILFNGIALFFFGPVVERQIGSRAFAALFIVTGVVAGLSQVVVGFALSDPTAVLGASGAIMAIMGVLTVLNPDMKVLLYFFIPVPIWLLTFGYAALSAVGIFSAFGGGIAHAAHLSGLVLGLLYGKYVERKGVKAPGQVQFGGSMGGGRRRF
ncbi:rhomboid family intramembrane serine protease [Halomarina oriensis]|uniref:Rhomboid family intramembrane serine protease n=1 Tax=Halomarina oriensis TaxID=671145 RepID=A0A6B0GU59_9EURY|nr:rhomboid family intramembrane serine protease [Halomarina oriensis]MWG35248.1 rhomboid family intramembrane serine protease [Halomarina oriensis]